MNINLYGPTAASDVSGATGQTTSGAVKQSAGSTPGGSAQEDTTTLTSSSSSVQSLTQTALQPFPSRADRVAALKLAVQNDQYQLDTAQIAEAITTSSV